MTTRSVLLATAMLLIGACSQEPEPASVENNAEMIADALEQRADNLEAMAMASSNEAAAALLDGADANLMDNALGFEGESNRMAQP